jgi:hypothetical protein
LPLSFRVSGFGPGGLCSLRDPFALFDIAITP